MSATVELRGDKEIAEKLDHLADPMRGAFEKLATDAETLTRKGLKPHSGDTGKLMTGRNIRREMAPEGTPLWAKVYTRSPIVITVDQGRDPGGKMPPLRAMASFAVRHGIPQRPDGSRGRYVPFYLARAILRRGTKGVASFEHAKDAAEKEMPSVLN